MRPKWMNEKPEYLCHPAVTIRQVAKVLRESASLHRRKGLSAEAIALRDAAANLDFVATGETWAYAFKLKDEP